MVCYRRNRNLRDILGQTKILKDRVVRKKTILRGRCMPCRGRADCLSCNHVLNTDFFTDRTGRKRFDIRHRVNCKTKNAIYLAFCIKCNQGQYVGKLEDQGANKRINKHRHEAKREDSIGIDRHFADPTHNFNRDFRLIIIEEITQRNLTKEQIRATLLRREDFWICKLGTLIPNGFNDRLNHPAT